jgi:hypothetical protein
MRMAMAGWLMPLTLTAQVEPPEHFPDPCALPEAVTFDLTGDTIEDVRVIGYSISMESEPAVAGVCLRAVTTMPGTTVLMALNSEGYWDVFVPKAAEPLTSEQLATALSAGRMRWSPYLVDVLHLGFDGPDRSLAWRYQEPRIWERLVFRAAHTPNAVIGILMISATSPQGEVSVRSASVVDEGQVLVFE